jgi:hypothetical protein
MSGFFEDARTTIKMRAILALIPAIWLLLAPVLAEAEPEAYDLRGKQIERLYENHTEQLSKLKHRSCCQNSTNSHQKSATMVIS